MGALSRATTRIGLCSSPPARLDGSQTEKETDGKRRPERWLVQRGQLLTAVFYFISFYFYYCWFLEIWFGCILFSSSYCFLEIRFSFIQRNLISKSLSRRYTAGKDRDFKKKIV